MRWTMPPQPIVTDTYDAVEVAEVTLRFPEGEAKSGGEVRVRRVQGDKVLDHQTFVLAPGEPDDMPSTFAKWLLDKCVQRGYAVESAKEAPRREAPVPVERPEPGIPLA